MLPHDQPRDPWLTGLIVALGNAVVANHRVGHADDLPLERRVGADLLVAGQRGREDCLTGPGRIGSKSTPTEHTPVCQGKRRIVFRNISLRRGDHVPPCHQRASSLPGQSFPYPARAYFSIWSATLLR